MEVYSAFYCGTRLDRDDQHGRHRLDLVELGFLRNMAFSFVETRCLGGVVRRVIGHLGCPVHGRYSALYLVRPQATRVPPLLLF